MPSSRQSSPPGVDVRAVLARTLVDRAGLRAALWRFVTAPSHVLLVMLPVVMRLVGYTPLEVSNAGVLGDTLLYLGRMGLFFAVVIWIGPRVIGPLMRRNVPFAVAYYLFWLGCCLISWTVMLWTLHRGNPVEAELTRFWHQQFFALICYTVLVLHLGPILRPHLGSVPALVPMYVPLRLSARAAPLAALLDPALTGDVLWLQARNQYVEVTSSTGLTTLVRISLAEAIDRLGPETGQRVHRSWWVSHGHAPALRFDRRALRLIDDQDHAIPVSRRSAAEVAAWLSDAPVEGAIQARSARPRPAGAGAV